VNPTLRKVRILLHFYRTVMVPNVAFSVILLVFLRIYPEFRGSLMELLWFKGAFFVLILVCVHFLSADLYYFYYNLGCTRRLLFPLAFLLEVLVFVLLYQTVKQWL
jgi:hypothetical protein